jgi:hypothetical protein
MDDVVVWPFLIGVTEIRSGRNQYHNLLERS